MCNEVRHWLPTAALLLWIEMPDSGCWRWPGNKERQRKYSKELIKVMYKVACLLRQGLRQVCGFFEDYVAQNKIMIDIPDYSTLSKRLKWLTADLFRPVAKPYNPSNKGCGNQRS